MQRAEVSPGEGGGLHTRQCSARCFTSTNASHPQNHLRGLGGLILTLQQKKRRTEDTDEVMSPRRTLLRGRAECVPGAGVLMPHLAPLCGEDHRVAGPLGGGTPRGCLFWVTSAPCGCGTALGIIVSLLSKWMHR